jgi:predicted GNAT superfamily acetyltransferase
VRDVQIRPLKTLQDFNVCEHIQKTVWGNVGVSGELMSVTQKYGGAVLGSIVNGRVVGFIYAFLARRHGKLIHWSHLMAVEPKFRDLGLGFRMKQAHRKLVLADGITSICWTYDPLQSRNAGLNIARLGGRGEEYVPNCYGRFPSAIEQGLESDRFVVNWRIGTALVEKRLRGHRPGTEGMLKNSPRINETRMNASGFPENCKISLGLRQPELLVEIPVQTDLMRAHALGLARSWRMETRKIFMNYFGAGYRAEGFIPPSPASDSRSFYVLRRRRKSAA